METTISLTVSQLEKVLQGTSVSKKHFLAKLTNVKAEEYKEQQLKNQGKDES